MIKTRSAMPREGMTASRVFWKFSLSVSELWDGVKNGRVHEGKNLRAKNKEREGEEDIVV